MSYSKKSNKYKQSTQENRADISPFDRAMLDLACAYSVSQNASIRKHGVSNLNSALQLLNEDSFNDYTMKLKYRFLVETVKQRMKGVTDRDILISAANNVVDVEPLLADDKFLGEITTENVNWFNEQISEMLHQSYLGKNALPIMNMCSNYLSSDFRERRGQSDGFRVMCSDMMAHFRRCDISDDSADNLFRLSEMEEGITEIHKQITSPTFKLVTGMVGLNAMLGGGFEAGNVYAFLGLPGEGKTVTLENILYQLWNNNKGYQCKDRTKRPCIVLLTMENFVRQTVCALFHILTKGGDMKQCNTAEEAIEEFKKHAFRFDPNDQQSIEIVIKYKPINSIDTNYLYKMVEDLEDDGYEVIAFLQDYIKRIRPTNRTGDSYMDLGTIIDEFKTFAMVKKIPVITASQLNRDAANKIDNGRIKNKSDLVNMLTRSNIGESIRVIENLDGAFVIAPEANFANHKYMGFKLIKHRYEIKTKQLSIFQPFYDNAEIAMVEDIHMPKQAFRTSLMKEDDETVKNNFGEVDKLGIRREMNGLNTEQMDLSDNMLNPISQEGIYSLSNLGPTDNFPIIFVDEADRERLREQYGIKKVL